MFKKITTLASRNRRSIRRAIVLLSALVSFGVSCGEENQIEENALEAFDLDGYVVSWSHACNTLTCSGSGTDSFEPSQMAGVDCDWNCAEYQGRVSRVKARF